MREIIDKPNYRALKTIGERKQAFNDYVDEKKKNEKEAKQSKLDRDRRTLFSLFEKHPKVTSESRWNKVKAVLSNEPSFMRSVEDNRQIIFEEWSKEQIIKQRETARVKKRENLEKFKLLLQTIEMTVESTWKKVQEVYKAKNGYKEDKGLLEMDPVDCLFVFEDHMKAIESKYWAQLQIIQTKRYRIERKNRDAFKVLLVKLIQDGSLHAKTKWKDIYKLVHVEACYTKMLGQPGSTPLDLFMDAVASLDEKLDFARDQVHDIIKVILLNVFLTYIRNAT